jgi:CheY-like chemotaxis protein
LVSIDQTSRFAPDTFGWVELLFNWRVPLEINQEKSWDRPVSPELGLPNQRPLALAAETKARSTETTPAIEQNAATQFRFRILVVDDQHLIRETTKLILEGRGYKVLTAAEGLDGLHALSKSLPDLIISHLNMPRMSGFEFLVVVRERFPHIASIAVSAEYDGQWKSFCGGHFPGRVTIPLTSFAARSRNFWLLLRSARRERRVKLPRSSCQERVRGI